MNVSWCVRMGVLHCWEHACTFYYRPFNMIRDVLNWSWHSVNVNVCKISGGNRPRRVVSFIVRFIAGSFKSQLIDYFSGHIVSWEAFGRFKLIRTKWRFWTSWRHFGCTLWRSQLLCSWRNFNFYIIVSNQRCGSHQPLNGGITCSLSVLNWDLRVIGGVVIPERRRVGVGNDARHVKSIEISMDTSLVCHKSCLEVSVLQTSHMYLRFMAKVMLFLSAHQSTCFV